MGSPSLCVFCPQKKCVFLFGDGGDSCFGEHHLSGFCYMGFIFTTNRKGFCWEIGCPFCVQILFKRLQLFVGNINCIIGKYFLAIRSWLQISFKEKLRNQKKITEAKSPWITSEIRQKAAFGPKDTETWMQVGCTVCECSPTKVFWESGPTRIILAIDKKKSLTVNSKGDFSHGKNMCTSCKLLCWLKGQANTENWGENLYIYIHSISYYTCMQHVCSMHILTPAVFFF